MNSIMPYFNKLYEALYTNYNWMDTDAIIHDENGSEDFDIDATIDSTETATPRVTTTDTTNALHKFIDTPQSTITNLENSTLLTNASSDGGTTSRSYTGENTTDVDKTLGQDGHTDRTRYYRENGRRNYTLGRVMKDYYEAVRNIDEMLFKELEVCFFQLW